MLSMLMLVMLGQSNGIEEAWLPDYGSYYKVMKIDDKNYHLIEMLPREKAIAKAKDEVKEAEKKLADANEKLLRVSVLTKQEVLGPIEERNIKGYGLCKARKVLDGPKDVGMYRVIERVNIGDPYGFTGWLNSVRASYGLTSVQYDANLSGWAATNNEQQAAMGMGHHIMGPARRQNAAGNIGDIVTLGNAWLNSPGHREALLDPTIRWIGIAYSGAYWTFNGN